MIQVRTIHAAKKSNDVPCCFEYLTRFLRIQRGTLKRIFWKSRQPAAEVFQLSTQNSRAQPARHAYPSKWKRCLMTSSRGLNASVARSLYCVSSLQKNCRVVLSGTQLPCNHNRRHCTVRSITTAHNGIQSQQIQWDPTTTNTMGFNHNKYNGIQLPQIQWGPITANIRIQSQQIQRDVDNHSTNENERTFDVIPSTMRVKILLIHRYGSRAYIRPSHSQRYLQVKSRDRHTVGVEWSVGDYGAVHFSLHIRAIRVRYVAKHTVLLLIQIVHWTVYCCWYHCTLNSASLLFNGYSWFV